MANEDDDAQENDAASKGNEPVIRSEELFGTCREVWIDHNGERYRLRITRRGKLILQK